MNITSMVQAAPHPKSNWKRYQHKSPLKDHTLNTKLPRILTDKTLTNVNSQSGITKHIENKPVSRNFKQQK